MKKFIIGFFAIWLIAAIGVASWFFNPKYIYPQREGIVVTDTQESWDQYCWYEYPNGYIYKKYVGHFRLQASVSNETSFSMSQCKSDNIASY